MEEIPILGVVVGKGQVKMEQEKIKAVKEWKTPTRIKDVESFLGFANFYWRFIHNFSHTARPLNELKGKKEWKWEEEIKRHLKSLKRRLQVNRFFPYHEERENSEWKQMRQDMQLEKYYPKNKMGNGNQ